ncbi:MAG: hypothetical protein ACI8Q1_001401 [Parvicella sp.]|jgi:hypothetical protein
MDPVNHKEKAFVLGVGFQKTGTSTLRESLKILGYKVKDTSLRALIPILNGNDKKLLELLDGFDAAEDTPWYIIYKKLDELIPNTKFVLTIREEESWYFSVKKHIGKLRSAEHEWVYGRYKGLPKDDKENTLNVYNTHNTGVIEYFKDRPNDLLILDFTKGDKWDKLCAFLNIEIPETTFPHYNKSKSGEVNPKMSWFKRTRKQLRYGIKIKYIDIMKLWDSGKK